MLKMKALIVVCSVALLSCSGDDGSVDADSVLKAPAVAEVEESEGVEGLPEGEGGIEFLGGRVDIPLDYEVRYDRSVPTEGFIEQRQIFLEITEAESEVPEIGNSFELAMSRAGFESASMRLTDGVLRGKFEKDDVPAVFILVRPDGVGPSFANESAVASVYLTQGVQPR